MVYGAALLQPMILPSYYLRRRIFLVMAFQLPGPRPHHELLPRWRSPQGLKGWGLGLLDVQMRQNATDEEGMLAIGNTKYGENLEQFVFDCSNIPKGG